MRRSVWKRAAAAVLAAALTVGSAQAAWAAGWIQDEKGWWYEREDGTWPVNTWWEDENGMWYLFDENGYIYTNCYRVVDGVVYPFLSNGMWAGYALADIQPGVWNGTVYLNQWSGLTVSLPEGTVFDYELDSAMLGGASLREFSAQLPDTLGASVQLFYQDTGDLPELTADQYAWVIGQVYAGIGMEQTGVQTVDLNGKTYTKVSANVSELLYMDCYFRQVGHYMENFLAMYLISDKEAVDRVTVGIR